MVGLRENRSAWSFVFVGDGAGVVKALPTWWKSKIRVVSWVISPMVSEETDRFYFLPISLMNPTLLIQWKLDCRSPKQKRKNQPIPVPVLKPYEYSLISNKELRRRQSSLLSLDRRPDKVVSDIDIFLSIQLVSFSSDHTVLCFW